MLEVIVKTMDDQKRNFSIPDNMTVRDFKEMISSSVNISVDLQRLIYQGRPMQDNEQVNESKDIDGRVIHLVERPPVQVMPTPAQLARQQVPPTTQPSTAPRVPVPRHNPANVLGPFPMPEPGTDLHSGAFVQQMIQQALSGMTSNIGPTDIRGSVRAPYAVGGDARTDIHIEITPQGSSRAARNVQARQAAQTSQPSVTQQQGSTTRRPQAVPSTSMAHRPQPVPSAPRRELPPIKSLLDRFEEQIKTLEAVKSGRGDDQASMSFGPATSSKLKSMSTSTERMDVQTSPPEGASGSSTHNSLSGGQVLGSRNGNAAGHPSLPFLGGMIRRLADLQSRFVPFQMEFADFLERDPFFSSTETPEFRRCQSFLTEVLKVEGTLAIIHRSLSALAIPLSENPPRHAHVEAGQRHGAPASSGRRSHGLSNT